MQAALRKFAVDDSSVSPYIYHRLLGHVEVDELLFRHIYLPKQLSAPNLPTLNNSQVCSCSLNPCYIFLVMSHVKGCWKDFRFFHAIALNPWVKTVYIMNLVFFEVE